MEQPVNFIPPWVTRTEMEAADTVLYRSSSCIHVASEERRLKKVAVSSVLRDSISHVYSKLELQFVSKLDATSVHEQTTDALVCSAFKVAPHQPLHHVITVREDRLLRMHVPKCKLSSTEGGRRMTKSQKMTTRKRNLCGQQSLQLQLLNSKQRI